MRPVIFVHRWLGVALSAIFLLWFLSGIVMMYRSYPKVSARDRLEHLPVLDPSRVKLSAEEAFAQLGAENQPFDVVLTSFDGRPIYVTGDVMIYADDGSKHGGVDRAMIDRAAAAWSGRPLDEATKTSVEDVDQWTLSSELRNLRPMYKYAWPDGQHVYVDGNTADVVQYTTTASRFWAYLGAIPHWMYFTPLRVQQRTWFSLIVYSAIVGTAAAIMGMAIAMWMYSPRRRYRHAGRPTGIPYRGWKRWHTVAGLLFGVMTTTWTFSGLLTMGPFPIIDKLSEITAPSPSGQNRREINLSGAFRGGLLPLSTYAARRPHEAIAAVGSFGVREVEFTSFAGQPLYLLSDASGDTRIVPVRGTPSSGFDTADLMRRIRAAAGDQLAELTTLDKYDAYYVDRRGERPLPVIYARLNDNASTRYYIDPKTASLVGSYSSHQWVERWLSRGLHSLDFPWLYNNRPLWDVVVIILMLGGTALCVTSLVLTWRVIARSIARVRDARVVVPSEDLLT